MFINYHGTYSTKLYMLSTFYFIYQVFQKNILYSRLVCNLLFRLSTSSLFHNNSRRSKHRIIKSCSYTLAQSNWRFYIMHIHRMHKGLNSVHAHLTPFPTEYLYKFCWMDTLLKTAGLKILKKSSDPLLIPPLKK